MGRLRTLSLSAFLLAIIVGLSVAEQNVNFSPECSSKVAFPQLSQLRINQFSDVSDNWKGATFLPDVSHGPSSGKSSANFSRPLPNLLDDLFLETFQTFFNKEQRMDTSCGEEGCNTFVPSDGPFVAVVKDAFVDYNGNVFNKEEVHVARRDSGSVPHPERFWLPEHVQVRCYKKLATILQPYEDSYYHFVEEALPRLLLVRDAMQKDPEIRLLTRTKYPFIMQFFSRLRIPLDRVEVATDDKKIVYHAEELLVPRPTPIFAPSREGLLAVHDAVVHSKPQRLHAHFVTQESLKHDSELASNKVIYVSRKGSSARNVVNEEDILAGIKNYLDIYNKDKVHGERLVLSVFYGDASVDETVALFKKARVIIGPHGAGLANMLWASQPAAVIEFLHSFDPLMVYWHTATAMGFDYWMLPVPESTWAGDFLVPQDEVIELLHRSLHQSGGKSKRQAPQFNICPEGTTMNANTFLCTACPPGTFAATSSMLSSCAPCAPGRYNPSYGATYCMTCPTNTFSNGEGATQCINCSPESVSVLIGGTTPSSCVIPSTSTIGGANPFMQSANLANLNQRQARTAWPALMSERKRDVEAAVAAPSVSVSNPTVSVSNPTVSVSVPTVAVGTTTMRPAVATPRPVVTPTTTAIPTRLPTITPTTPTTTPIAPSTPTTTPLAPTTLTTTPIAPTTPTAPTTITPATGGSSININANLQTLGNIPAINAVISVNAGENQIPNTIPRPVSPLIPPINTIFTVPPPPAGSEELQQGSSMEGSAMLGSEMIMGSSFLSGSEEAPLELLGAPEGSAVLVGSAAGIAVTVNSVNPANVGLNSFSPFNPVPVVVVSVGPPSTEIPTNLAAAAPSAPTTVNGATVVNSIDTGTTATTVTTIPTTTTVTPTTTVTTFPTATTTVSTPTTYVAVAQTSPASRSTWFLYDLLF